MRAIGRVTVRTVASSICVRVVKQNPEGSTNVTVCRVVFGSLAFEFGTVYKVCLAFEQWSEALRGGFVQYSPPSRGRSRRRWLFKDDSRRAGVELGPSRFLERHRVV